MQVVGLLLLTVFYQMVACDFTLLFIDFNKLDVMRLTARQFKRFIGRLMSFIAKQLLTLVDEVPIKRVASL